MIINLYNMNIRERERERERERVSEREKESGRETDRQTDIHNYIYAQIERGRDIQREQYRDRNEVTFRENGVRKWVFITNSRTCMRQYHLILCLIISN